MRDTVSNRLSDMELTAFVTACAGERLDDEETIALTKAMLAVGERIHWGSGTVLDKHCVGGLPGNRTTPIIVAIVAAAGHRIPKTSSRAITSPAGTADAMEVMAPVALDLKAMRRVVEGGLELGLVDAEADRRPHDFRSERQGRGDCPRCERTIVGTVGNATRRIGQESTFDALQLECAGAFPKPTAS
jgi:hypothetical protein